MAPTFLLTVLISAFALFLSLVKAETHTVKFDNQCGYGTPQLIQGNKVLTTTEYTFDGSYSGIAYLQNGSDCGFNGENCGTIEMTLINPTVAGGGSSADISYIPPLAYSVPYKFEFYGGCEGQGASCTSADCADAFYQPDQTYVQVACQNDNVNLLITFCDGNGSSSPSSSSSASSPSATTSAATIGSSTQVEITSTKVATSAVASPSAIVPTAASSSTAASPSSSSRRCRNRKRTTNLARRAEALRAEALRSHRRRSPVSRL